MPRRYFFAPVQGSTSSTLGGIAQGLTRGLDNFQTQRRRRKLERREDEEQRRRGIEFEADLRDRGYRPGAAPEGDFDGRTLLQPEDYDEIDGYHRMNPGRARSRQLGRVGTALLGSMGERGEGIDPRLMVDMIETGQDPESLLPWQQRTEELRAAAKAGRDADAREDAQAHAMELAGIREAGADARADRTARSEAFDKIVKDSYIRTDEAGNAVYDPPLPLGQLYEMWMRGEELPPPKQAAGQQATTPSGMSEEELADLREDIQELGGDRSEEEIIEYLRTAGYSDEEIALILGAG